MSKLKLYYSLWLEMQLRSNTFGDVLGSRIWLMREFSLKENTAKYMSRMFYHWSKNSGG